MGKVTGLGGVFFKCADPERMYAWYETHLGMKRDGGEFHFQWVDKDTGAAGTTVWALFKRDTNYFAPSDAPFMLNYRVDDLDGLLERLRAEGVSVDDRREEVPIPLFTGRGHLHPHLDSDAGHARRPPDLLGAHHGAS